jgi:hypothetical protein
MTLMQLLQTLQRVDQITDLLKNPGIDIKTRRRLVEEQGILLSINIVTAPQEQNQEEKEHGETRITDIGGGRNKEVSSRSDEPNKPA